MAQNAARDTIQGTIRYDAFKQPIADDAFDYFRNVLKLLKKADEAYANKPSKLPTILYKFQKTLQEAAQESSFDPTKTYPHDGRYVTPLWITHQMGEKSTTLREFRDSFYAFYPTEVENAEILSKQEENYWQQLVENSKSTITLTPAQIEELENKGDDYNDHLRLS